MPLSDTDLRQLFGMLITPGLTTVDELVEAFKRREKETGADVGNSPTGDVHAEVLVSFLLGTGACFSHPDDYALALEWAVRAYRAGLAGKTLHDYVAGEYVQPEGPL